MCHFQPIVIINFTREEKPFQIEEVRKSECKSENFMKKFLCLYGHAIQFYTTEQRNVCKESVTQSTKCNGQTGYTLAGCFHSTISSI